MNRTRWLIVGLLLVCLCVPYVHASDPIVPVPHGRPLSDEELIAADGELGFLLTLLIYTVAFAGAGAGGAAVHENWFDEDYGIDGDDWSKIGCGAAQGAICGATGGMLTAI